MENIRLDEKFRYRFNLIIKIFKLKLKIFIKNILKKKIFNKSLFHFFFLIFYKPVLVFLSHLNSITIR